MCGKNSNSKSADCFRKLRETRWLARAIVHPRRFSDDDARRSRQSSPAASPRRQSHLILRACRARRVGGARIRRRFYDLASPSSSGSFGAPRRIQFWFQSAVPVAIRPAQRVGPVARVVVRFARSFTLVRTRARLSFQCFCERQCRSSRVHGRAVVPARSDPAKRRRATITTTRHASKLDARRNTRYEGSSPRARRDGQRGGGCERQRRGLRLRIG